MYEWWTCGKRFPAGWSARESHCLSTGHHRPQFECDTCPEFFFNQKARMRHMDIKGHHAGGNKCHDDSGYRSEDTDSFEHEEWTCALCDDSFYTEDECWEHEVEEHFYCSDCCRGFSSLNGVENHMDSKAQGLHTFKCPRCEVPKPTVAAITRHVENGRCPGAPGMNRDSLYQLVRSMDTNNRISRQSIFDDRGIAAGVRYVASETAWNGRGYECFLCHRTFKLLEGLNSHLNSETHEEILYHCPKDGCNFTCKSLAGTMDHLESESCGAMRASGAFKLLTTILDD